MYEATSHKENECISLAWSVGWLELRQSLLSSLDPATNKVHNVGAGHADFDECVNSSQCKGQKVGKKARVHEPVEVSKMSWPDLDAVDQGAGGDRVRVGGGTSGNWQPTYDDQNYVDEEILDVVDYHNFRALLLLRMQNFRNL